MIQSSQTDDPPTTCDLYYLSSLVQILSLSLLFLRPCVPLAQKEVVIKRQKLNYLRMKRWEHLPGAVSTNQQRSGSKSWKLALEMTTPLCPRSLWAHCTPSQVIFNLKWHFPTSPVLFWPQPWLQGDSRSSWHSGENDTLLSRSPHQELPGQQMMLWKGGEDRRDSWWDLLCVPGRCMNQFWRLCALSQLSWCCKFAVLHCLHSSHTVGQQDISNT